MSLLVQMAALVVSSAIAPALSPLSDLPLIAGLITGSGLALNVGGFRAFERLIVVSVLLSFGGVNHG